MIVAFYKTKAELKAAVGEPLRYGETSIFGREFDPNGRFAVVGPSEYKRKWYATVTMINGRIAKVT
jgi:hypothetical protein